MSCENFKFQKFSQSATIIAFSHMHFLGAPEKGHQLIDNEPGQPGKGDTGKPEAIWDRFQVSLDHFQPFFSYFEPNFSQKSIILVFSDLLNIPIVSYLPV